jgi:hypothetical protein
MATTLLDVITDALSEIGVLASGEVPNAGQSALGLRKMNDLVDLYKAEDLLVYTITRTTATLTASQTSFTVGTGANIAIPRPMYIDSVGYVNQAVTPNIEIPLTMLRDEEYAAIAVKNLTAAVPTRAYYNPTFPNGTLYPLPIPTTGNLLWAVYYHAVVPEFVAVSDAVALPPGYRRMLITNLAVALAPSFPRQIDPFLARAAAMSKEIVKRSNRKPHELSFDRGAILQGGDWFDIRKGY